MQVTPSGSVTVSYALPTRMWTEIDGAPGLRTIERVVRGGWSLRSFALVLPDGGTLVVSPTASLGEEAHRAIGEIGAPKVLLAPNHFHHLGIPEWRKRHPGSMVVASSLARERLSTKQPDIELRPLEEANGLLPDGVTFLEPPGTKTGETWLRIETNAGVAWLVSDAFFHLLRDTSGFTGMMLRASGTVPGLRIGSTFLWLGVRDRKRYASWLLDRLAKDAPRTLVVGHGEPVTGDDLAARLRALVETRVL